MSRFNLTNLLKFLVGIILVQAATAIVVFAAGDVADPKNWALLAVALAVALFAAFWFSAIAGHASKEAVAHARESFFREREKIRVRAEKEKTKIIEKSQRRITRETNQVQAKANFKVGASLVAALAVGGVMMLTQFFTVGLVLLSGSGGALAGYLTRIRQESRSRGESEKKFIGRTAPTELVEAEPDSRKPSFGSDS